jgi:hypothetical protein
MEIMSWQKSYEVPRKSEDTPKKAIGAIAARIRCDCTTLCGQKGGDPGNGDALIPVLVH